ncbi:MAG: S9 family peptidase [Planctomycetota bacterium]
MAERLKAKWTAEDFYALQWVDEAVFSPDGKRIVFTVREVEKGKNRYRSALWIVKTRGGRARRLTWGESTGDRQPAWSPDGRRIAFTSSRYGLPQIYLIELSGGEARPVTSMARGAHSPAFAPDGKRIAFLSRVNEEERIEATRRGKARPPGEAKRIEAERKEAEEKARDPRVISRLLYRTGQEWVDGRWDHVYVQSLRGSKPPLSLTSGAFHHTRPTFHPDGESLFTTSERTGIPGHEEVYDILRVPLAGGEPEFVTSKLCVTSYDVSPDGVHIAYASVPPVKYYKHPLLARLKNLETGEETPLTESLDGDVGGVKFGRGGKEVLFQIPREGVIGLRAAPLEGGETREVAGGHRKILVYDVSRSTGGLALVSTAPDIPADLYVVPPDGEERRVTALCKGLIERRHTSVPEEIQFEGHEGLPIQGWVMEGRGCDPSRPGRLAVEVHGGPHVMWGNEFWHEFQVLASAGYTVFFCNPRGSGGYGLEFKGMLYRNWGVNDAKDVLAGVDRLVKEKRADPERLYIAGGSYGGYLTAWIVTHDTRFKAAVAQRGVYNLLSMYNGSDAQCLLDWEFDTSPWDDPMLLVKHSPVHYADRVKTPTMVMHAECDFTATIPSAEEFYNALKRNGVDARFVRYPREGHELSRSGEPDHRVDRIQRILQWFETH